MIYQRNDLTNVTGLMRVPKVSHERDSTPMTEDDWCEKLNRAAPPHIHYYHETAKEHKASEEAKRVKL